MYRCRLCGQVTDLDDVSIPGTDDPELVTCVRCVQRLAETGKRMDKRLIREVSDAAAQASTGGSI